MKKLIFVFGSISGFVIISINTISMKLGFGTQWLGYLVMLIAFSSIFVAVKQYRDESLGGVIRFTTGFTLGLGITVVASVVYVLVWEIYLAANDYAFIEDYIATLVEAQRAANVSEAQMQQVLVDMEALRESYANPLMRLPITFLEIFPVGLLVSLVAALTLRKNP